MLEIAQQVLKAVRADAAHDRAVHLQQATVRVECEAFVPALRREPAKGALAEADVEDRVHHARHRDLRPRANRKEQGFVRVTKASAKSLLDDSERGSDGCLQALGERPARLVRPADVGRDREPGRDRDPERSHLVEAGRLPAEEL